MFGGKPPLRSSLSGTSGPLQRYDQIDLDPLPWSDFFDQEIYYTDPGGRSGRFHCYTKGQTGNLCIILLHGGGYSGLSFGLLTESLYEQIGENVEIVAIDLRGHGLTEADESDLDLNTFSQDVMALLNEHFNGKWPQVVLVGHSLGGAIAVDIAHKLSDNCAACILLDITESNAIDNLSGMQALLKGRPQSFSSIRMAIFWTLNTKTCTNCRSSRLSVPGMIRNDNTNVLASVEVYERCKTTLTVDSSNVDAMLPLSESDMQAIEAIGVIGPMAALVEEPDEQTDAEYIEEQEQDQNVGHTEGIITVVNCIGITQAPAASAEAVVARSVATPVPIQSPPTRYVWRINLTRTEQFWAGWFAQLSHKFVTSPTQARMLILAGSTAGLDRDAEMLKGQIMGKFVHVNVANSGHLVHENEPDAIATNITQLLKRHRIISTL